MRLRLLAIVTLHALASGCSEDEPSAPVADAAVVDSTVAETSVDSTPADTMATDTAIADTAIADTAIADTTIVDSTTGDTLVADTTTADTAMSDGAADVEDTATADTFVADTAPDTADAADAAPRTFEPLVFADILAQNVSPSVHELWPDISFRADEAHSYVEMPGSLLGCVADHYDSSRPPPASENGGAVTLTGYAGGTFVSGGTAPSSITCSFSAGAYACAYGGTTGVSTAVFAAAADPLGAGPIALTAAGASSVGSISASSSVGGAIATSVDLNTLNYSSGTETVIPFSCTGGCGTNFILLDIVATQNTADKIDDPSPTLGRIRCRTIGATSFTVSAAALATAFGGDSALKNVRTRIVRLAATNATDSFGNAVRFMAGRGVQGIAAR